MHIAGPLTGGEIASEHSTTNGVIAIRNLDAQIAGYTWQAVKQRSPVADRAALIGLHTLRGHLLGRIADYERAAALAEELVAHAPSDGEALLARAGTRATLHRFTEALTDLDATERLGLDPGVVDGERAAIYQAIGRYDDALAIRRDAVARRAGFDTLAALAGLYAARGQIAEAEHVYQESRDQCRSVSPFPVAMLDFQRGQMWMRHAEFGRARTWFRSACSRVAAYAPAQGHLAEVEAILGDVEAAILRLRPLTDASDDPDYPAHLARILAEAGRVAESRAWRARAAARYDQLMSDHAEAFADHAAEFWLMDEADPAKAWRCAKKNYEVRQTPRALDLLSRASAANTRA